MLLLASTTTIGRRLASLESSLTLTRRVFSSRHVFEETHHLSRSLSRNPKQFNRKWRPTPKVQWTHPVNPEYLHRPPTYEMEALDEIHQRSYQSNILLEIRDVRLPASSHHPSMTRLAKHRKHLICYTHADLIDAPTRDKVEEWTARSWPDAKAIFVDTRAQGERNLKKEQGQENQDGPYDLMYESLCDHLKSGFNTALTVGVANTGKSSVLMALLKCAKHRGDIKKTIKQTIPGPTKNKKGKKIKRKLAKVKGQIGIEDVPGKTRQITEYLLRDTPRCFFLDVPGLTPPTFFFEERPEAWFGFGAANLLPLGKYAVADIELQELFCYYVLHCMNRNGDFGYVIKLDLDGPTDDLDVVLKAVKRGGGRFGEKNWKEDALRKARCKAFLKLFNTGNFGPVILDDLSRPYKPFVFKDLHFRKDQDRDRDRNSGGGSCFNCGEVGHMARDCPMKKPERQDRNNQGRQRNHHKEEDYSYDSDDDDDYTFDSDEEDYSYDSDEEGYSYDSDEEEDYSDKRRN